jgi:hypothetical protein
MPVRVFRLGEEPDESFATDMSAEQRLEMLVMLSSRMLELTGAPYVTYPRAAMPFRIIRPA